MSSAKYSQLHRRLLFHWTGPRRALAPDYETPVVVKSRADRQMYLDLLGSILQTGLRFSIPSEKQTEWIEMSEIRATHPMLCFSEWGIADSSSHSGRYGFMGLGFTRKFVMSLGGRPVVYLPNTRSDPFRKALIAMIRSVRKNPTKDVKLCLHADFLASYLKAYNFKRIRAESSDDSEPSRKKESRNPRSRPDDHHLRLDFGGVFANLEDREWRVLSSATNTPPQHLSFSSGELAMIVFPDHQTLSLAMRHEAIMDWVRRDEKPSVCLISREMIMSI